MVDRGVPQAHGVPPGIAGRTGSIMSIVPEHLDLMIVYEPGEDGWMLASIPEVPGVFSQGRTREEARANVIDALRLMLSPQPRAADDQREREALHITVAA
jgi:predicted RNase H-like HicB family nuclease